MRLYSIFTPSHAVFKDEWLLESLVDDFEFVGREISLDLQLYGTPGFNKLTWLKLDLLIQAIKENWGRCFLYSDVDVQFFARTENVLLDALADKDVLFQRDSPQGHICCGFIVCRANNRTLDFFKSLRVECASYEGRYDDQDITNKELFKYALPEQERVQPGHQLVNQAWHSKNQDFEKLAVLPNDYGLDWGYLPETFCSAGTLSGEFWEPGKTIVIPEKPLIHHANWTIGIQHKLAQLQLVKRLVRESHDDSKLTFSPLSPSFQQPTLYEP